HGALESIAVEMGVKLMRMSYSSIIRESEDFGAALIDTQGRQLCETRQSTPLQSGPIAGYVRGIVRQTSARADEFRPGDVIMHNDAYAEGLQFKAIKVYDGGRKNHAVWQLLRD